MKRKYLLALEPVKPRTGGTEHTVRVDGTLIVVWRWENGQTTGLYAMDVASKEYETYKDGKWHRAKLAALLGRGKWYGNEYARCGEEEFTGEVKAASELVEAHIRDWKRKGNLGSLIGDLEGEYAAETRERKEQRRVERINRLMGSVPALPDDFKDWILSASGCDKFYSLKNEVGQMYCSCCGKTYEEEKKTGCKSVCPNCGAALTVNRKNRNGIEKQVHAALIQSIDAGTSVARHFDITVSHCGKRHLIISESERLVIYRNNISMPPKQKPYKRRVFYNQNPRGSTRLEFDNIRNPYSRRIFDGYLYPSGIREALENTKYQYGIRALETLAKDHAKLDYGKMMHGIQDVRVADITEYLHKGRFQALLKDLNESCGYYTSIEAYEKLACLHLDGRTLDEIFGLDKQAVNRLRDINGGAEVLNWLQRSKQKGEKISDETLKWLMKEELTGDEAIFKSPMSLVQVMNFIRRQQAESYPGKPAKSVISQWDDYMRMCRRLEKDTTDEMVYRPRELKRRHDECVEEIRKRQAVVDMKNNREASEARAAKLRGDYPEAERILREIKPKYEYGNDRFLIIVPNNLVEITLEGHALHHCVASSDRYFERIERQETYICFLRRANEPETPFYTIEIEPGGTIRQHRSYFDEEPNIEEIRGFLKEWQQAVKKRISEEDRRLAKESRKLREANIEELKQKNNRRVLLGLMQDFMEAV